MKIAIHKDYEGHETKNVSINATKRDIPWRYVEHPHDVEQHEIPVGGVRFVEAVLMNKYNIDAPIPDYWPTWAEKYNPPHMMTKLKDIEKYPICVKPVSRYKAFPFTILESQAQTQRILERLDPGWVYTIPVMYWKNQPGFNKEMRIYVADGKVLAHATYQGNEHEWTAEFVEKVDDLESNIPATWCGTLDVGWCDKGLRLIKAHHPYSIGWYESINDSRYLDFVIAGWKYLTW